MQSQCQRLTDSQWEAMEPSLPTDRKRLQSLRVVADSILYVLRADSQRRSLPAGTHPEWQLVHCYFRRWKLDGTLERLNWAPDMRERRRQGKENTLGVELEISSKPPGTEGFVPVKWRWATERAFGMFSFFRRLGKDHEKTAESAESWGLWQNCRLILKRLG